MADRAASGASQIVGRLERLRGTLRRRLLLYGGCAVGSGGIYALLAIVALDWLLGLPPLLRMLVGGAFLVGFALAALHWVVRPVRARLTLAELAAQLERQFAYLNDRLSSAVGFLRHEGVGSEAMQEEVIANTAAVVHDLPIRRALTLRPLLGGAAFFALSCFLLAYVFAVDPSWLQIGVGRYLAPRSGLAWPRRVQIVALTRDQKVAYGESAIVKMQVVRGARPTLRGVVRLRDAQGDVTALAMDRNRGDIYACTIDNLTEPLEYWFEAGDDSTAAQPRMLRIVRRPVVVSALGRLLPPAYAAGPPAEEIELTTRPLRAVRGSTLALDIRASKPIARHDGAVQAELVLEDGLSITLGGADDNPALASTPLPVERDLAFMVRLVDEDGLVSRGGPTYRIEAVDDQPPTVTILEPRSLLEVTPTTTIQVLVQAEDDLGVTEMSLVGDRSNPLGSFAIPLPSAPVAVHSAPGRFVATANFAWDLRDLAVNAGDTVVYRARVHDNFRSGDTAGHVGTSAPLRLAVIGPEVYERRQREIYALLEERVRETVVEQERLAEETERLHQQAPDGAAPDRAALAGIARAQAHLADTLTDIAQRVEGIVGRLDAGGVGDAESKAQARRSAADLRRVAGGPMQNAVRALDRAEPAGAAAQQRVATDELRRIVNHMGQWGDFAEIVTKTRRLLDAQQKHRAATTRLTPHTLGRDLESLSEDERTALHEIARAQALLADETEQLLARMRELSTGALRRDAITVAALDDAVRAAVAAEIVANMRDAADALTANRAAAAQIGQRLAEAGVADMLAALQQRQKRQLEQLAKSLETASQAIAALLEDARAFYAATQEALNVGAEADVFIALGRREHRLEGNTRRLADEWRESEDLSRFAAALEQCAAGMEDAAGALRRGDGAAARAPQQQTIAALEAILAELERLAAEARTQVVRQQLAITRAKLEAVRSRQEDINSATAQVRARLDQTGRLDRLAARKAATAGRAQDALRTETATLRADLGEAVVYDYVLGRVAAAMGASADALAARRVDDSLAAVQTRVLADLDLLIAAIADIYNLPSPDEFARSAAGSAGAAGMEGPQPPVPTLAELLVLKAMQSGLNERTGAASAGFSADTATEAKLQELRQLADEQEEIQTLTRQVTEKAKQRAN